MRIRHTRYSPTAASHHAVLRGGVLTGREAAARRRCVAPRAVHGSPGAKAVVAQRRAVMVGLLGFSPWLVSVDDARATNNFGSGLEDEDSPLIQGKPSSATPAYRLAGTALTHVPQRLRPLAKPYFAAYAFSARVLEDRRRGRGRRFVWLAACCPSDRRKP